MSAQTQLQIKGLARDPNAFQAAGAGALRRAENVVVRSAGVAESRPNFTLAFEGFGGSIRIEAMHEFDGQLVTIESNPDDSSIWGASVNGSQISGPLTPDEVFEPPSPDDTETQFAEARGNLYLTGIAGGLALEDGSGPARFAGVEMSAVTDWHGAELSYADLFIGWDPAHPEDVIPIEEQVHSVAYRFVFVRKDSSGYVRRSAPSFDLITTCIPGTNSWGSGTRFYIPYAGGSVPILVEGDQVEFYRTRSVPMGSPRANVLATTPSPYYYLAFTYTLTAADAAAGYFAPPKDVVTENDLGAELYTNPSQFGAVAAKFPPPRAQVMAAWERVMWFGRTVAKHRSPAVELQHLYRAGPMRNLRIATADLGMDYLTLLASLPEVSADGLVVGMLVTDNYKYGPTVNGTVVAAGSRITKIETVNVLGVDLTRITLSNPVLTGGIGGFIVGTMDDSAPQGLIAEKTGNGTYTSGSKIVTGLTSTVGWKAGMYWTDSTSGPDTAGTKVPFRTKIESVDSAVQIHMTKVALASGTVDAFVGDVVTVDSVDLYAWIEFFGGPSDKTSHTRLSPWDGAYPFCFPIHDARFGDWGRQSAVAAICQWVTYYALALGVRAQPNGYLPTVDYTLPGWNFSTTPTKDGDVLSGQSGTAPDIFSGYGTTPYPEGVTGFSLEEVGIGGAAHTLSSTTPSAFSPALNAPSTSPTTNENRPNRLYFSDLDEPESVPLVNYIDIGSLDEPIQALVPLRDALLVFKTDGLWRITGSGPSSWSVDPLDATIRLVRPETVCTVNGVAYAWCDRGFFGITEAGIQSLSANKIDVELRAAALFVVNRSTSHGAFVVGWHRHNLVLLGVPDGNGATACAKVYAFSLTTGEWTEWPMAWGTACESRAFDAVYYSRPADDVVDYEVRIAVEAPPRGYDREFALDPGPTVTQATTLTIAVADCGAWQPVEGDFIGASAPSTHVYRRITFVSLDAGVYTLTLEAAIDGVDIEVPDWRAREGAPIVIEWHPAAPARIPTGAFCREIHVQLDLRDADQKDDVTTPWYLVGGTSERDTSPTTLVSSKARVAQIQPLRVGASRQIARSANIAPYFETNDIVPIRVLGISLVYESTSERTTR